MALVALAVGVESFMFWWAASKNSAIHCLVGIHLYLGSALAAKTSRLTLVSGLKKHDIYFMANT